jgi:hypothetical protein
MSKTPSFSAAAWPLTIRAADVPAMTTTQSAPLTSATLDALSDLAFAAMSATQVQALNGLSAAAIGDMSASEFATAPGGNIAGPPSMAAKGVTAAEASALSVSQPAAIASAPRAALSSSADPALLTAVLQADGGLVISDFQSQTHSGFVSYNGLLKLLQDAASGGMTAGKFAALNVIAGELNATGGVATLAYDQQIFNDVVTGNSANAYWTGGASSRTALGNLTATSSATQVDELIGKWFLGTDLPNPAIPNFTVPTAYQTQSAPLFGASGAPKITDVNQGATGDCYFLASLAEIAQQDPTAIEHMIKSNGNGTYSVEFQVGGKADYVTVNNQLDNLTDGWTMSDNQTLLFDNGYGASWSALIEKAYAELNEQTGAMHGADGAAANSYNDISGGWASVIGELTGQSVTNYWTYAGESASSTTQLLTTLQAALAQGQDVDMGTSGKAVAASTNLVASHMFAVIGVNATAGTVTLYNPWGQNGGNMPAEFTISIGTIVADGATFAATTGKSGADAQRLPGAIFFQRADGFVAAWNVEGGGNSGGAAFGNPGAGWGLLGVGDFDGNLKPDMLFKNTDGTYALWQTDGASINGGGAIGNPGGSWACQGLGDFNGDGISDLLFRDAGGNYATWDLHGTAIIGGGSIGNPGAGWSFAGVGDFNGDGTSDILFQNGGTYAAWDIGADQIAGGGTIGSPGGTWVFKGAGDFNGDGKSDLLFEDAGGSYATWDISGSQIVGGGTLGTPGSQWQFAGIADIFGNRQDSILFSNTTTGAFATWDLSDAIVRGGSNFGSPGAGWAAKAFV